MAIEETGRAFLRTRSSRTTTPQSTSTTLTRTPRPVVSSSATRLSASPRSPSPSASWRRHPDDQPHFYRHLQDADLPEDEQRHHHQPAPPRQECTIAAAKLVLDAAVRPAPPRASSAGSTPSIELTNTHARGRHHPRHRRPRAWSRPPTPPASPPWALAPATRPPSSTTPPTSVAVNSIIHSKTFDNGMICASEQSVTVLDNVYDEVKAEFAGSRLLLPQPRGAEKVRKTVSFKTALSTPRSPAGCRQDRRAGRHRGSRGTKILIGEVTDRPRQGGVAHEKLSPVLGMYKPRTSTRQSTRPSSWLPTAATATPRRYISTPTTRRSPSTRCHEDLPYPRSTPRPRTAASATCTTSSMHRL